MAVRRGIFNMDEYRHAIERMSPRHYLSASCYERSGLENTELGHG